MTIAEDLVSAWLSAEAAENLAEWAGKHKSESELIEWAKALYMRLYGAD